eukprot:993174-Lingulodinium_polyedra.AAC.1
MAEDGGPHGWRRGCSAQTDGADSSSCYSPAATPRRSVANIPLRDQTLGHNRRGNLHASNTP